MWAQAALAATLACSWIEGAQAVPISGVEPFIRNEANPQFICNWESPPVYFIAKFSSVFDTTFPYKNIVVLDPSPEQDCWSNLFDEFPQLPLDT